MALPNPFTYNPIQNQLPSFQTYQAQQQTLGGFQPVKTDLAGSGTIGGGWSPALANPQPMAYQPATLGGAKTVDTFDGFARPPFPGSGGTSWNLPEWAYGGNQKGASTYNAQTGQWDPTGTVAAGSDVFGAKIPVGYDPRQDRGGLEYNGRNVETFWSRFLRFARDSGLPPEQAMQTALARLRTDNGGTLAGTGFSDAAMPGAAPTLPGSALPGQTPLTVQPDGSVAHGTPAGGAPVGGGVPGAGSGAGLATTQRQYLIDDPEYALRYMLKQRGIDVDQKGLVGSYMRSKYLNPLKAAISATGLGTGGSQVGDIESVLAQFGAGLQGRGNELENFLHGIAQRAQGNPALNDLSDQDLMALEENLGALGTFGANDYIASARKNQYDDLKQGFGDLFFGGLTGGDMPSFAEYMRQRNYRPY